MRGRKCHKNKRAHVCSSETVRSARHLSTGNDASRSSPTPRHRSRQSRQTHRHHHPDCSNSVGFARAWADGPVTELTANRTRKNRYENTRKTHSQVLGKQYETVRFRIWTGRERGAPETASLSHSGPFFAHSLFRCTTNLLTSTRRTTWARVQRKHPTPRYLTLDRVRYPNSNL